MLVPQKSSMLVLFCSALLLQAACGQATDQGALTDEDTSRASASLTKAQDPTAVGHKDFCNDPTALCDAGEGDCDSDAQCSPGNYCGQNNGERFGLPANYDVCVPLSCTDGQLNGDETDVDCGGAFCAPCAQSGDTDFCASVAGGCGVGEGDCDGDAECQAGLVCKLNNGPSFNLPSNFDVCVPASCNDGIQNNGETGIDCGGTCGDCLHVGYNGGGNFCDSGTLCGVGEGDCDSSAQCEPGLICARDNGPKFGMPEKWDVCVPAHCTDDAISGDETDIDCGGSCGQCPAPDHCSNMVLDAAEGETDIDCGGPCAPCAPTGDHQSSSAFGGTGADLYFSVAALPDGGSVAVGYFADSVTIGGTTHTSAGNSDVVVTKYDSTGQVTWTKRYGSTSLDRAQAVTTDEQGNIYVAGYFRNTVDFDGQSVTSVGNTDAFIIKLDGNGTTQWATSGGGVSNDLALAVGVDKQDRVTIAGRFKRTANFGGSDLVNVGGDDIFVAQFNASTGQHNWSRRFGGLSNDTANSLAVDSADNIVVSGRFEGSVDFGTGSFVSRGIDDVFVVKLSANGSVRWSKQFGSTSQESAFGVAVARNGTIAVVGRFAGPLNFGQGTLTPAGNYDAFVTVMQPNGSPQWTRTLGTVDAEVARAAAFDAQGNLVVGGYYSNTIDLGTGAQTASGPSDLFLVKYGPTGTPLWFKGYGGAQIEEVRGVAITPNQHIVAVGTFYDSASVGGATFTSAGLNDGFVGQYAP